MIAANSNAIDEADGRLAPNDPAGIVDIDVAGRQRAHGHRHGLGAGIAAHRGNDRHQHRQRHHLFDGCIKQADHPGGEDGGGRG
jgi:hypothetical protein